MQHQELQHQQEAAFHLLDIVDARVPHRVQCAAALPASGEALAFGANHDEDEVGHDDRGAGAPDQGADKVERVVVEGDPADGQW